MQLLGWLGMLSSIRTSGRDRLGKCQIATSVWKNSFSTHFNLKRLGVYCKTDLWCLVVDILVNYQRIDK